MKYVLISGGVISGIGKGIIASSTGLLLKTLGLKVSSIKIDPYMNVDAGTMAPTEHGEVFVLNDGGEVDLDLGNYERYLNITLTRENNITTGKIYQHVIEKERRGDYLGRTVQVVPHLTDATQDWVERVARIPVDDTKEQPDACIIELGGTVGDIESAPFIEAMRQLRRRAGKHQFVHIHVSLVPVINGEQKTKPTQQAIRDVRSAGLSPDLIACRCSTPLDTHTIDKIAMYCQVESEQVIAVHDVSSTYHVPMLLEKQRLVPLLSNLLNLHELDISPSLLSQGQRTWSEWKQLTSSPKQILENVTIVLVGKYINLHDSYLSVIKSLEHAAMACSRKLNLIWVDASHLEDETRQGSPADFHKAWHEVCTAQGILVPGGFGKRGTEGMIAAANWARQNKTPYLGVCLGMQIAVIEYARHVCGLKGAGSEELDGNRATDHVIKYMPEIDRVNLGASMRLGLRPTYFQVGSEWSRIRALYCKPTQQQCLGNRHMHTSASSLHGLPLERSTDSTTIRNLAEAQLPTLLRNGMNPTDSWTVTTEQEETRSAIIQAPSASADPNAEPIFERHRHRYEVNSDYVQQLTKHGLNFVGKDENGERMEILELKDHPYFVGVQFHPEYLSRVLEPSKPYLGLIAASIGSLEDFVRQGSRNRGPIC